MEKKRSIGVIILSIFLLLCVIPGLIAAFIGGISHSNAESPAEIALDIIMRILFITSPVVFLVTAIGLLELKNWARILTMILFPVLIYITSFGVCILFDVPPILILVICGIFFVLIIYYLTRPKVKEQFK